MRNAKIIGIGSFAPEKIVTNEDISKIVDTSDEWIKTRTGIQQRHLTDDKTAVSDMGFLAAKKALDMAKITPDKIDLIITATCSPDTLFPSVSCIIQDRLAAYNSAAFDLSAACSGFNYALSVGSNLITAGSYNNVLVIGADALSKYVDWTDRGTCVLFGDGAGAVVLTSANKGEGILSSCLAADGRGKNFLVLPGGGSRNPMPKSEKERCIYMDGKEVFKFAVKALEKYLLKAVNQAKLKIEDINLIIPHQANIRIIEHVANKLHIPINKFFINLQEYGNTSSASIPIALDEAYRSGMIRKNDIIATVGFGAGLTCGANIIHWEV